jgi:hypothetical protein
MNQARPSLLTRATGAHRYAVHLIDQLQGDVGRRVVMPRSRPRAIASMIAEQLQIACRALVALHEEELA